MDDTLVFDDADFTFNQNVTVAPFQACPPTWIDWDGNYDARSDSEITMAYIRCTPGGAGCIACGPTRNDDVTVSYSQDCEALTLTFPEDDVPRTYFPV